MWCQQPMKKISALTKNRMFFGFWFVLFGFFCFVFFLVGIRSRDICQNFRVCFQLCSENGAEQNVVVCAQKCVLLKPKEKTKIAENSKKETFLNGCSFFFVVDANILFGRWKDRALKKSSGSSDSDQQNSSDLAFLAVGSEIGISTTEHRNCSGKKGAGMAQARFAPDVPQNMDQEDLLSSADQRRVVRRSTHSSPDRRMSS